MSTSQDDKSESTAKGNGQTNNYKSISGYTGHLHFTLPSVIIFWFSQTKIVKAIVSRYVCMYRQYHNIKLNINIYNCKPGFARQNLLFFAGAAKRNVLYNVYCKHFALVQAVLCISIVLWSLELCIIFDMTNYCLGKSLFDIR